MTTILRLDCSPKGADAHSWKLADELMGRLAARHPGASVVRRNLGASPVPAPDKAFAAAMITHQSAEAARGVAALSLSETLIGELEASDVLVISTPMHNFAVPACLKAWIDQIVRFGRTFRSTPEGKTGLLRDRPAYVIVASGGHILPPKARQPDFLTGYLSSILLTIGIQDITLVPLEGLSRGEAEVAAGWAQARAILDERLRG